VEEKACKALVKAATSNRNKASKLEQKSYCNRPNAQRP
jgi:ribosomal protein L33